MLAICLCKSKVIESKLLYIKHTLYGQIHFWNNLDHVRDFSFQSDVFSNLNRMLFVTIIKQKYHLFALHSLFCNSEIFNSIQTIRADIGSIVVEAHKHFHIILTRIKSLSFWWQSWRYTNLEKVSPSLINFVYTTLL